MSAIGNQHVKCKIKGCKGRASYWSEFCKTHREAQTLALKEIATHKNGDTYTLSNDENWNQTPSRSAVVAKEALGEE